MYHSIEVFKTKYRNSKPFRILVIISAVLALFLAILGIIYKVIVVDAQPIPLQNSYQGYLLDNLKSINCTNCDSFLPANVGFKDLMTNPYPNDGYDTVINKTVNCYANIKSKESYEILQMTGAEAQALNSTKSLYLTHTGQCGVCSTLKDLAVYLSVDLTRSVKTCGFSLSLDAHVACLQRIGFTEPCLYIWLYNTRNTKKECLSTCLWEVASPNNQPNKGIFGSNPCDTCANTINNQRTCYPEASQEGSPLRLNACLQCDECKSGPIFQKDSGRTRRNTGISSEIKRPEGYISQIDHIYGLLSEK